MKIQIIAIPQSPIRATLNIENNFYLIPLVDRKKRALKFKWLMFYLQVFYKK